MNHALPNPELIPVCILSGYRPELQGRREGCLETWIPHLDRKFLPVFVTGDPTLGRPWHFDPPFLIVKCGDYYSELPGKVRGFCRWALENFNLRWIFKCDDDSYLNAKLFNAFPFENWDWVGHFYWDELKQWKVHGCGYSLSRRCVELVAEHLNPYEQWEDVNVSKLLQARFPGIRVENRADIQPWSYGGLIFKPTDMVIHMLTSASQHHRVHEQVIKAW